MEEQKNIPELRFPEFSGDWEVKKLGDLLEFKNGINASREQYGKGVKFINVLDILNNELITYDKIIGKVDVDDITVSKYPVNYGDILFQRSSETREEVGTACVYLDKDHTATFGGFVIRGRKIANYDPVFLNKLLKTDSARDEITSKSGGSTRYNVGQETLSSVKLYFPHIKEQEKIASFLTAIDEKLQALKKKKSLLEQYKKGVMQKIFSQEVRFKDDNEKAFPEWKTKKIGDITSLLKDGTHGTHKDSNSEGYYLLSAKNIINGKINIDSSDRKISKDDYDSIYKNYQLKPGDILLTIVGTIGRSAIWQGDLENIAFQRSVAIFRFKECIPEFMYQIFCQEFFQTELLKRQVVSAQPGIYLGDLAKIELSLPTLPEQKRISTLLSSIDEKINYCNTQIEKTEQYKKGLLQKMFV